MVKLLLLACYLTYPIVCQWAIDELVTSHARSNVSKAQAAFELAGEQAKNSVNTPAEQQAYAEWEAAWQLRYEANQRLAEIEFDGSRN